MQFQPPRGMRDLDEKEMAIRRQVFKIIKSVVEGWGYREVEPTFVEELSTLAAKSGEEIKNEIYAFKDQGNRELGLRFDFTVGYSRMAASQKVPRPWKVYGISMAWRYDRPQAGRYRCFWQWDTEIFGVPSPAADAETIAVNISILEALGLKDFEVRINSRKIVEGVLDWLGIKNKAQLEKVMRSIDKIKKISKADFFAELKAAGIERVLAGEILSALDRKGSIEKTLAEVKKAFPAGDKEASVKKIDEGVRDIEELAASLKKFGVIDRCILDLSIVRGIGYYTGIVFEAFDKKNEDVGAIFAGGRFDDLCAIYGQAMPATGAGGGVERLLIALEKNGLLPQPQLKPDYYVVAVNDGARGKVWEVVTKLRKKGVAVDADLMGRSLSAQMEFAAKLGVPKAIIIGDKELRSGLLTIKDMSSGAQSEKEIDEIELEPTKLTVAQRELAYKGEEIVEERSKIERLQGELAAAKERAAKLEEVAERLRRDFSSAQRDLRAKEEILALKELEFKEIKKAEDELRRRLEEKKR